MMMVLTMILYIGRCYGLEIINTRDSDAVVMRDMQKALHKVPWLPSTVGQEA